ncbi:MAG: tyrosine-type recombinase/integrase [Pseudomonadota bacterium]
MTIETTLFDPNGRRLYLTPEERVAFRAAALEGPRQVRTFCTVLHDTGCRISEALALTPMRIDLNGQAIVFESLKKRRNGVYRAVPVPEASLDALDMVHGLREQRQAKNGEIDTPLWGWSRMTAYRKVMEVMNAANIEDGPHKCPKGLRHAFGIQAITKGVPLNMLQKWMGHAKMETTAIYANALGEQQREIAARMW